MKYIDGVQQKRTAIEEIIPFPLPNMPGMDDSLESDFHVLLSKEYPAEMVPFLDGDQVIAGLFEEIPASTIHKLFVGDFMEHGKGLVKLINKLQEVYRSDILEMHISSYGGSFTEVVQLHNLIDSMFKARCTTYMNHGYSGGAMAFVMAKERIIYKHSTAMFHFFSGGERGKGHDMLDSLQHSIGTIGKYYREQLNPYFTKKELTRMIKGGKEFWMDSTEMMNRGVATGIIIGGEYFTSEDYFKKYNKQGEVRKKWHKEQKKIKDAKAEKER